MLRGLDYPVVARIGEAGLAEASECQEHFGTNSKCEVGDQEAEDVSSGVGNGYGMQPTEENVVIPNEFNLSGVLHSLMRY